LRGRMHRISSKVRKACGNGCTPSLSDSRTC
jgi:hypothetical protein